MDIEFSVDMSSVYKVYKLGLLDEDLTNISIFLGLNFEHGPFKIKINAEPVFTLSDVESIDKWEFSNYVIELFYPAIAHRSDTVNPVTKKTNNNDIQIYINTKNSHLKFFLAYSRVLQVGISFYKLYYLFRIKDLCTGVRNCLVSCLTYL